MVETAKALGNKGEALGIMGKNDEEIACYEAAIEKYGHSSEPGLMAQTARAIIKKGFALGKMKKKEEAIECYEVVIDRYGQSNEPALMRVVARATWFLELWKR